MKLQLCQQKLEEFAGLQATLQKELKEKKAMLDAYEDRGDACFASF